MGLTNEFERDLTNQAQLKRPGRVDLIVFQNVADAGDGSPGIQRAFRNYLHEGGMEKDLQLIEFGIKGTSVDINNAELQQLSNIGASVITTSIWTQLNNISTSVITASIWAELSNISTTTISTAQWGYVGGADQAVKIDDSVQFGGLALTGNLTLVANSITGTSVDINNAELQQLSAIGTTTITGPQWAYVGALNQGLTTTSNVAFGQITPSGNIVMTDNNITFTTGLVDGVDVSTHNHSGADQGGTVAFSNLSGDIIYTQLDSIVNITGGGSGVKVSRADHVHTAGDGSSKVDHVNLLNKGSATHAQIDTHLGNTANPHTVTLDQAFDANRTINAATSNATAFRIGGTRYLELYENGVYSTITNSSGILQIYGNTAIYLGAREGVTHALAIDDDFGSTDYICLWQIDATTASEKGWIGKNPTGPVVQPLKGIWSFEMYTDDGQLDSYSHVDDLQLLRELQEWDVKEKPASDLFPNETQKVFDKETLPWIVAHTGVSSMAVDDNRKRYALGNTSKIGYLLSTIKKLLERQDKLISELNDLGINVNF